jgi:hypothetical protein
VSDSPAVVRRILLHNAAPVRAEDTPPAAEALRVDEVSETLADRFAALASDRPVGTRQ